LAAGFLLAARFLAGFAFLATFFLADFLAGFLAAFLADFFADLFFADFLADFLADFFLADFFADFLADFFAAFFAFLAVAMTISWMSDGRMVYKTNPATGSRWAERFIGACGGSVAATCPEMRFEWRISERCAERSVR
jgi:hypothetical protein